MNIWNSSKFTGIPKLSTSFPQAELMGCVYLWISCGCPKRGIQNSLKMAIEFSKIKKINFPLPY